MQLQRLALRVLQDEKRLAIFDARGAGIQAQIASRSTRRTADLRAQTGVDAQQREI
jgi:hypothetical protein